MAVKKNNKAQTEAKLLQDKICSETSLETALTVERELKQSTT